MSITRTLTLAAFALAVGAAPSQAQTREVSGLYQLVWQVARDPSEPVRVIESITDDAGVRWRLEETEAALRPHGGALRLNGRRLSVVGGVLAAATGASGAATEPSLRPTSARPLDVASSMTYSAAAPQMLGGSMRYVTILCKLTDTPTVPHPPQWYHDLLTTETYPSMSHYWRESSENRLNLEGSAVFGWYELPTSTATYNLNAGLGGNLISLASDCTNAADADVDFSQFHAVNIQINVNIGFSAGGGGWIAVDGPGRGVPMTWMAAWASHATYGHEVGHSIGLPHSSGPYAQTYDSDWDVMSGGAWFNGQQDIGTHTIALHKYWLGWVPQSQIVTLEAYEFATARTILQRSGMPANTTDHLLLRIPLGATREYTVEARHKMGEYEIGVPRSSVIIHDVDITRPDRAAQVVDIDGNGNTNDFGASWLPGESFVDPTNGIAISVLRATSTGYEVLATRGGTNLIVDVEGAGRVTSAEGGIDCDDVCGGGFPLDAAVVLTAVPSEGSTFLGWSACAGVGPCTVTLDQVTHVTATFGDPVAVATETLPAATMGAEYSAVMHASGGMPPFTWAVTGGALPEGLSLDPSNGHLSGVAAETGVFDVIVTVTAGAFDASRDLTMSVTAPALARADVMQQLVNGGSALDATARRYLDLLGNRNGAFDIGDVRAWLQMNGEVSSSSISAEVF